MPSPPRYRKGVGKSEEPNAFSSALRKGVGKNEEPYAFSSALRKGVGKNEEPYAFSSATAQKARRSVSVSLSSTSAWRRGFG